MEGNTEAQRQIDNDRVVVTRWTLPPGATTGPHRHDHDYVVVPLVDGELAFVEPSGGRGAATLGAGVAYFRNAGVEHDVSNPGAATVAFVEVELR